MTRFSIEIFVEKRVLSELSHVPKEDLVEYSFSLLTASVRFTSGGHSLMDDIVRRLGRSRKLDSEAFHGIVVMDFLKDLVRGAREVMRRRHREEVSITAAPVIMVFSRGNGLIKVSLEARSWSNFEFDPIAPEELKLTVAEAVESLLAQLSRVRPEVSNLEEVANLRNEAARL